jgi:uncharacterized protein YbjT (DUF2867 family)
VNPPAPSSDPGGGRVLVTGATGYIGGRLVPELLDAGRTVRCLARAPAKLEAAAWRDRVEVVEGDVLRPETLAAAMAGCEAAYYLVHAIGVRGDWAARDARAAANARDAAAAAGLRQIVYLGGMGDDRDAALSPHLASRQEVGRVLAAGPVPVTELRAAVIIGSGSASFEMLRYLVEVLPAMVTPRWVHTRCQPVAVRDVLRSLVGVLGREEAMGRVLELGGPDVVTYLDMMRVYAEEARLRRRVVITVPVLTPRLSSLWVGLVTPLPSSLARPLVDSLVNEVIVRDDALSRIVPGPMIPYREAVRRALARVGGLDVGPRWADATGDTGPADAAPTDPGWAGGSLLGDDRMVTCAAPAPVLFRVVTGVGGERGWYVADWLWGIRGLLDAFAGGVGRRRGRRHPDDLRVGDTLDFWRVEAIVPDRMLRLRAEMRLPGHAWLEWEIHPDAAGEGCRLEQRARFAPRGVLGRLYWYGLLPVHALLFPRLARRLAATAAAWPVAPGSGTRDIPGS